MSRKKTLVRTLIINAVPQGYVEAVVAATLCSNFIHVTCGGQGGGGASCFNPTMYSEVLSLHLCTSATYTLKQ